MIDYSPSETTDYLLCPRYRQYRWLDRRAPRTLDKRDLGRVVGLGIHAGLACHYRHEPDAESVAHGAVETELAAIRLNGQEWEPAVQAQVAGLGVEAEGAVRRFRTEPQPAWTIHHVERRIGHGVLDLIVEDRQGLMVVDTKTTRTLESRYQSKRLLEFETSWQFRDYAVRAGDLMERPITRCLVQLLILGPQWRVIHHPLEFTTEALEHWRAWSAEPVWRRMELDAGCHEAPRNLTVCHNTGYSYPCVYYEACWGGGLGQGQYVTLPPREERV